MISLFSFIVAVTANPGNLLATDPLFKFDHTNQGHVLLNCVGPGIDGYTSEVWAVNDMLNTVDDSQVLEKSVIQGIVWESASTQYPFPSGYQLIPPWATDDSYVYRRPSHWDSFGFQINANANQLPLWQYAGQATLSNRHYRQTISAGIYSAGGQQISWAGYTCTKVYYVPATALDVDCPAAEPPNIKTPTKQCSAYQGFCVCPPNQVSCYQEQGCVMCVNQANQCPPDSPAFRP
ncbi:hypothetical protein HDV06_000861 [Boothiomyces sp. JEL0866]|nr:hypothetical protein HDV06_000861 [Boothiomyces sp. JEL0866]